MAIFTPNLKAGPFHDDDNMCIWHGEGQQQTIERDDPPVSAFRRRGTDTDLCTPIEPDEINICEGPEHTTLIHYPISVHKALQAEFDIANGGTPPARSLLPQSLTTENQALRAQHDGTKDDISLEPTVFINHPTTVRDALQAEFKHASNDVRSKFPLLIRRAAVKRKTVTPPLVCIKDWPNGNGNEYVGAPHEWASALKADLQGVDGAPDERRAPVKASQGDEKSYLSPRSF